MDFTDQMAAKLLAQAVRSLGLALNETLCVQPDRRTVRTLIADVRTTLVEFEDAYEVSPPGSMGKAETGP